MPVSAHQRASDPATASESVRRALADPAAYPHRPATVEVRETHISWVFLAGGFAYKLKKPIVLDFLDYGSAARRLEMCREEVRLNRRLAADLYLGVRGVAPTGDAVELTEETDPRAIDFVVEMRRYDEGRTLEALLARGELERADVVEVGRTLARFHAAARPAQAWDAPVPALERRFERNVHELLADLEQPREIERVLALERFTHAFVTAHAGTFQERSGRGLYREGHGDLRADHVLVDGGVRVVDCVEFDPEFRELDVADDLSFLVFDLVARGGEGFAERLVEAYRDAGGDAGEDWLIAFYAVYRALVRAKVALVRGRQLPPAGATPARASARARDLILVAERFAWHARLPLVIVVCGAPASGKSYLARALAEISGLPHLSSDATRKRLAGIRPAERAPSETYGSEWNRRTYAELGRCAARAVTERGGGVVDATFRHLADRQIFASSLTAAAPQLFVECRAPRAVLAERAARREHERGRISDADREIVMREYAAWEPLDEVPADAHLVLRTDRQVEQIVGDVLALLDRRLLRGA